MIPLTGEKLERILDKFFGKWYNAIQSYFGELVEKLISQKGNIARNRAY